MPQNQVMTLTDRAFPYGMYIGCADGDGERFTDSVLYAASGALFFNPADFADFKHGKSFHQIFLRFGIVLHSGCPNGEKT